MYLSIQIPNQKISIRDFLFKICTLPKKKAHKERNGVPGISLSLFFFKPDRLYVVLLLKAEEFVIFGLCIIWDFCATYEMITINTLSPEKCFILVAGEKN